VAESRCVVGLLRELEDGHRFELPEELEHFLLAVARGLRDDEVAQLEEGAGLFESEPVT
jgi:hypothetical protein